jgi:hypothetical protein
MHRRPLGNGRRLAMIGAIVLIVGCLLPWYTVGGDGGLPQLTMRAFDGTGIASFLAALATLALIALPYAAGDRPVGVIVASLSPSSRSAVVASCCSVFQRRARRPEGSALDPCVRLLDLGGCAIILARAATTSGWMPRPPASAGRARASCDTAGPGSDDGVTRPRVGARGSRGQRQVAISSEPAVVVAARCGELDHVAARRPDPAGPGS